MFTLAMGVDVVNGCCYLFFMSTSHVVAVRIEPDVHAWLVSEQARLYRERSLKVTLSTLIRSVLQKAKDSEPAPPRRKVSSR